jgi:hypothetical protein
LQAATTAANSFFDSGRPVAVCHSRNSEEAVAGVTAPPATQATRANKARHATPRISYTLGILQKLSPSRPYPVALYSAILFSF